MDGVHNNFDGVSLGERLRAYREQAGVSAESAAREMKIPARSLRALEEGDWHAFSAKVYATGVARRVAKVFAPVDADAIAAAVGREWDIACGASISGRGRVGEKARTYSVPRPVAVPRRLVMTPRRLGMGMAAGGGMALAAFLAVRLTAFVASPGLVVKSPADRSGFATPMVDVAGKTEKESSLTVNGREITLDEQGNFSERIELPSGANELHFISRNRFGKAQTVVRNIFVE